MQDSYALSSSGPLLLIVVLVLGAGLPCRWLASKLRVPDVVLYLVAGMLLQPLLAGGATAHPALFQATLVFGASYILFEGGVDVRSAVLREIWITVTLISTLGVLITAAVTAAVAHQLLGLPWPAAFLLGAIIAATDPAALIPMFRQVRISERLAQTVICEAAFNDAVSAALTLALVSTTSGASGFSAGAAAGAFLAEAGIGILAGIGIGLAVAFLAGHSRYGVLRGQFALLTLAAVAAAYAAADLLGGSGFMAVFVAGIVVGNRGSFGFTAAAPEAGVQFYVDSTAALFRMIVFITLGAQIDVTSMGRHAGATALIVAAFVFLARPLTVLACALPDRRARWSWRELLFMCWIRETGIVPGTLAGLLLAAGTPFAGTIATVVFSAILFTLLVQGTSTRWLAGQLGVLEH